jgi:translation initiation factor IF-2
MNLKSSADCNAEGTVLDARVDKGQGVVVTALVQKGNLKIGDCVLAGPSWGRVRRILSDQNEVLKSAGPSTPVQV